MLTRLKTPAKQFAVSRMLTRLRTPTKQFAITLLLIASVACSQSQKVATETNTNENVVIAATPPFQTKEPERYRATRQITITPATGETTVTTYLVARDGELRRFEFDLSSQRVVQLITPEGKFVLAPAQKTYVELTAQTPLPGYADQSDSSPDRLLHTEPTATSYQRVGSETIGGRATEKYRAIVNSPSGANVSITESFIWIDDALHMPIKSETTASDGKRVTTELKDITLEVDRSLFQIPEGYEKITMLDFSKRLSGVQ
jgi:outer membrane lipoprotein-sorting protein